MRITFNCDKCSQLLAVDQGSAGLVMQCPNCSQSLLVPPAPSGQTSICPRCSGTNSQEAKVCIVCRRDMTTGELTIPKKVAANTKQRAEQNVARTTALLTAMAAGKLNQEQNAAIPVGNQKPKEKSGLWFAWIIIIGFVVGFGGFGFVGARIGETAFAGSSSGIDDGNKSHLQPTQLAKERAADVVTPPQNAIPPIAKQDHSVVKQ